MIVFKKVFKKSNQKALKAFQTFKKNILKWKLSPTKNCFFVLSWRFSQSICNYFVLFQKKRNAICFVLIIIIFFRERSNLMDPNCFVLSWKSLHFKNANVVKPSVSNYGPNSESHNVTLSAHSISLSIFRIFSLSDKENSRPLSQRVRGASRIITHC